MQLNTLFQLSMEEVLGVSRQQVQKFVDRASSRTAPGSHAWRSAIPDVVVDFSDGGRLGRVMLRDRIETIVIGDHTIAVEEV